MKISELYLWDRGSGALALPLRSRKKTADAIVEEVVAAASRPTIRGD